LSYNHLLNIPKDSFAYQKKLVQLHLNNNKIGVVRNKTFAGTTTSEPERKPFWKRLMQKLLHSNSLFRFSLFGGKYWFRL
jgi:hypothetical protein